MGEVEADSSSRQEAGKEARIREVRLVQVCTVLANFSSIEGNQGGGGKGE